MQCKDLKLKQKEDKIRVPKKPCGRSKCREKNKLKKVRTPRRNYQVLLDELRQKDALAESDVMQPVMWNNSTMHHPSVYGLGEMQTCEGYAAHLSPGGVGIAWKDPAPHYVQNGLVQTSDHPGCIQFHPVPSNETSQEDIKVPENSDGIMDLIQSWTCITSSLGCIPTSTSYASPVTSDSVQVVQHHAGNDFMGQLVTASNEPIGQPVAVANDSDYGSAHLQTGQRCTPYMGHPGNGETWNGKSAAACYPASMQMLPALTDGNQRFMQYHTIQMPAQAWRVSEPAANRSTVYSVNRTDENVSPAVSGWFGNMDAPQSTINNLSCMPITSTSLMPDSSSVVQHHSGGQQVPSSNVSDYSSAHLQTSQGCPPYLGHPGAGVTWTNNPAANHHTPIQMVPTHTDEHQRFMNSYPTSLPLQNGRFPEPAAKRPMYSLSRNGEQMSPAFSGLSGYLNTSASGVMVQHQQQQMVPAQETCLWYQSASSMSNPGPNLVAETWNNNPAQYCPPMQTISANTNGYQSSMQFHPVESKSGALPLVEASMMAPQAPPAYVSSYKCDEQRSTDPMGQPVTANNSHYGSEQLQAGQKCAPYVGLSVAGETWSNNMAQYCQPMQTMPAHNSRFQGSLQFHPVEPKPGTMNVSETSTVAQQAPAHYVSVKTCDEKPHTEAMGQPANDGDFGSGVLGTNQIGAPHTGHSGNGDTWHNGTSQFCPPMHTMPAHANIQQGAVQALFHPVESTPGPNNVAEASMLAQQAPPHHLSANKCDEQPHSAPTSQSAPAVNDSDYGSAYLQTGQRCAGGLGAGETRNNNAAQLCPTSLPNAHQGSMQFHTVEPQVGSVLMSDASEMAQQASAHVSVYKCDEQTLREPTGPPAHGANEAENEAVHSQARQRCTPQMGHFGAQESWNDNPNPHSLPMSAMPAHANKYEGAMHLHSFEAQSGSILGAEAAVMAQQAPTHVTIFKCEEQTQKAPLGQPVPVGGQSDSESVHLLTSPGVGDTWNSNPDQYFLPMTMIATDTNGYQRLEHCSPFEVDFSDFSGLSDYLNDDPTKPQSIHIFDASKMDEQASSPCESDDNYEVLSRILEEHLDREECLPT